MTVASPIRASIPAAVYPVDREHGGLRLVILLAFLGGWVAGGLVLSALITASGLNLLAVLGGFLIGYLCSLLAERFLKPRWRSGREIQIDDHAVRLVRRGVTEAEMRHDQPVEALAWRFEIRKRARIPKGWSMLAIALESDSQFLVAYTFLSPQMLEALPDRDRFRLLAPRSAQKRGAAAADAPSLRLAGEERRLRAAEEVRWALGAEMTPEDFASYRDQVAARFPEWAPLS